MNKTTMVKMRKDGAITVPKKIRGMYELKQGKSFTIEVSDGNVVLKPYAVVCPICGKVLNENTNILSDCICSDCNKDIAAIIVDGEATTVTDAIDCLKSRILLKQNPIKNRNPKSKKKIKSKIK